MAINCRDHLHFGAKDWYTQSLADLDDNALRTVMLIRREANSRADLVARYARRKGWSWCRLDACPLVPNLQFILDLNPGRLQALEKLHTTMATHFALH
ncbi:hypothetical protein QQ045_032109 [Rhodiola kirilowii]